MSEGWQDWPLLGVGWKRRTAIRKSGNTCGHTDTYYQSPTGHRFRSKPQLSKFLGESVDLSLFNFKQGTIIQTENRVKTKKKKAVLKLPVETKPENLVESHSDKSHLPFPLLPPEKQEQNGTEDKSLMVRCNGCKTWCTGVDFGRAHKRTTWYCADCRASRREFHKEQKRLKNTGCGICAACILTEDCGHCSICVLRLKDPELGGSWKCTKRRCLKAIHKPGDCGLCQGCTATEDCETCAVCLKRHQNPNQEMRRKCVKRICHNKKAAASPPVLKSFATKKLKLKTKWKLMAERDGSVLPSEPKKKSYFNKVKGKIKKKKIQEKYIPVNLKSSNHPVILERLQREKLDAEKQMEFLKLDQGITMPSRLPIIRLERLDYKNGGLISREKLDHGITMPPRLPIIRLERLDYKNGGLISKEGGGWVIGKKADKPNKPIKEECVKRDIEESLKRDIEESIKRDMENDVMQQEVQDEPLDLHCPVKSEEFVVETDDMEGPDESTPVITQIFSLGTLNPKTEMEHILVEFLNELNEIPLPAHWEVLPHVGPTLQLVQRSKSSTMSETVVHIQPGLHFHIIVREYTVPSIHELFRNHPSRLTTVDDVVELICDLEAYRPCAGLLRRGPHLLNCGILTIEEWCPACRNGTLHPWPSGYVF